ncbi:MAG: glutamate synthase family protein, partial [Clostridia bacterium]|nr:glutamate synthase family protein [Clostridia bacterium]
LILSDKGFNDTLSPIPALLAVSGLHHHLIRNCTRTKVGIILESGEPREVHHFAVLIGYGASAINPYLAFDSIKDLIAKKMLTDITYKEAIKKYIKTVTKSVVKILSKMGISTIQSYQGAQIFEAIGINQEVIDRYFTRTASRIGGLGLEEIALETLLRHQSVYTIRKTAADNDLDSGGDYQWRADGEYHMFNPETIHKLQYACRTGSYELFKEYSNLINKQTQKLCTIRGLMSFKDREPIALDEVESVASICKRFKTGAMSYGSISQEAHESIAIAMNRLGGKSNTGEGGENPSRFKPMENGDSKCSAIKQVASGRFGVTSHYLVNAREIQIKMAQGAKKAASFLGAKCTHGLQIHEILPQVLVSFLHHLIMIFILSKI